MECFAHILSQSQKDFVRVRLYDVKGVTNYEHEWVRATISEALSSVENKKAELYNNGVIFTVKWLCSVFVGIPKVKPLK